MKKNMLFVIFVCLFFSASSQLDSASRLEYTANLNDIWGYVDDSGNEYALVGLYDGLSIVDVSNPYDPIEVYRSKGPETIWRDIKVYGNYAYVSNEAGNGIRIYDLSVLPNSYQIPFKDFDGEDGKKFQTAHNLFIDENGRVFVVGTDRKNGMIIYDLVQDAWNPKEIGFYDNAYIHDIYVRGDTAYAALINKGEFYILDVSNTNNINLISSHSTKDLQTHNTWLSMDGDYLFTTDEVNGAEVGIYNIHDIKNPEKVESFKSRLLGDEMPHNVLIKDSVAFISYYRDGIIALDISNPDNVVEVDRFDTDKERSGPGSQGAWGVYPFLPSGNILVSDIENGLYVLRYSGKNASYLEGVVKDLETNFPLNGVNVEVNPNGKKDKTYFDGAYKVGKIGSGDLKVEFSLIGYKSYSLNIPVFENKIILKDVLMEKLDLGELVINLSLEDNKSTKGASAFIYGDNYKEEIKFDSTGVLVKELPEGDYIIYIGKWGYINECFSSYLDSTGHSVSIELTKGYYDDFSANQGWEVFSVKEDPIWERAQPRPSYNNNTGLQHDPSEDASNGNCNAWAFCTGINEDFSAIETTVNWTNYLVSPEFEIPSSKNNATISFFYWLGFSDGSNDTIKIGLIHETDTSYLIKYTASDIMLEWKRETFDINSLFNSSGTFKFIVRVTDDLNPWDVVDCAIDEFVIEFINGVEEIKSSCLHSTDYGWSIDCENNSFRVLNSIGQVVKSGETNFIDFRSQNSGVYIIEVGESPPQKIYWNEEKW